MGAYDRVRVEGVTLNRRTAAVYAQIKVVYKTLGGTGYLYLAQGSYNRGGVDASKGTHDGGGAMDIMVSSRTARNWRTLQKAARMCGVASWDRPYLAGHWGHHNHCIVLGDKQMSSGAASQVRDYYAHRNGLAGHAADNTWHPSIIYWPVYKRHNVNYQRVRAEAKKSRNWIPKTGVIRVQRALNKKLGAGLRVDGLFGPATKKAYAHWERVVGGDGDGIPGRFSLILLSAGRFNVKF